MAGGINLASKYSNVVDERWTEESQVALILNSKYDFTGEKTVKVYSIPVSTMHDYKRGGLARYGDAEDLTRNVQTMTITKDRSFTFILDKGDKLQSEMVSDAGASLNRQLKEVAVPEYDRYCFKKIAEGAIAAGGYSTTAITKENAYECFLAGREYLGEHNVPDAGVVAFCTYKFANYLMQDPAFIKYGDKSQEMITKGVIGQCDGITIVKVSSKQLPAGAAFLMASSEAAVAPKQLDEYKIHDDPPGISGWLVEGRMIYDCFILNEKRHAIYYHGGQSVLKTLDVMTAATDVGKTTIIVNAQLEGAKFAYETATNAAALTAVTAGSAWTAGTDMLDGSTPVTSLEITPTSGHTMVRVVELDSAGKAIAYADAIINIGE